MAYVAQAVDGKAVMARPNEDGVDHPNVIVEIYDDMHTPVPALVLEFPDHEAMDLVRAIEEARRA